MGGDWSQTEGMVREGNGGGMNPKSAFASRELIPPTVSFAPLVPMRTRPNVMLEDYTTVLVAQEENLEPGRMARDGDTDEKCRTQA
jgi:hypothetical protein